jgi:hypothetical protein
MKPAFFVFILILGAGLFRSLDAAAQNNDPQDEHARLLAGKKCSLIAPLTNRSFKAR